MCLVFVDMIRFESVGALRSDVDLSLIVDPESKRLTERERNKLRDFEVDRLGRYRHPALERQFLRFTCPTAWSTPCGCFAFVIGLLIYLYSVLNVYHSYYDKALAIAVAAYAFVGTILATIVGYSKQFSKVQRSFYSEVILWSVAFATTAVSAAAAYPAMDGCLASQKTWGHCTVRLRPAFASVPILILGLRNIRLFLSLPLVFTPPLVYVGSPLIREFRADLAGKMFVTFFFAAFAAVFTIMRDREIRSRFEAWIQMKRRELEVRRRQKWVDGMVALLVGDRSAEQLKGAQLVVQDTSPCCTIVACKINDFHTWMLSFTSTSAALVCDVLHDSIDRRRSKLGLQLIAGVGDCYIAAWCLQQPQRQKGKEEEDANTENHHHDSTAALAFVREIFAMARAVRHSGAGKSHGETELYFCIGVATGPCEGALLGTKTIYYNVGGPTFAEATWLRDRARPDIALLTGKTVELSDSAIEVSELPRSVLRSNSTENSHDDAVAEPPLVYVLREVPGDVMKRPRSFRELNPTGGADRTGEDCLQDQTAVKSPYGPLDAAQDTSFNSTTDANSMLSTSIRTESTDNTSSPRISRCSLTSWRVPSTPLVDRRRAFLDGYRGRRGCDDARPFVVPTELLAISSQELEQALHAQHKMDCISRRTDEHRDGLSPIAANSIEMFFWENYSVAETSRHTSMILAQSFLGAVLMLVLLSFSGGYKTTNLAFTCCAAGLSPVALIVKAIHGSLGHRSVLFLVIYAQCLLLTAAFISTSPQYPLVRQATSYLATLTSFLAMQAGVAVSWRRVALAIVVNVLVLIVLSEPHVNNFVATPFIPILFGLAARGREMERRSVFLYRLTGDAYLGDARRELHFQEWLLRCLIPSYVVPTVLKRKTSEDADCVTDHLADVALAAVRMNVPTKDNSLDMYRLDDALSHGLSDCRSISLISCVGDNFIIGGPLQKPAPSVLTGQKTWRSQVQISFEVVADVASLEVLRCLRTILAHTDQKATVVIGRGDGLAMVLGRQQPRFQLFGFVARKVQTLLETAPLGFKGCTAEFYTALSPTSSDEGKQIIFQRQGWNVNAKPQQWRTRVTGYSALHILEECS